MIWCRIGQLYSSNKENLIYLGHFRCIECVKASPYLELANELEITKAITYLKEKEFNKVQKMKYHGLSLVVTFMLEIIWIFGL